MTGTVLRTTGATCTGTGGGGGALLPSHDHRHDAIAPTHNARAVGGAAVSAVMPLGIYVDLLVLGRQAWISPVRSIGEGDTQRDALRKCALDGKDVRIQTEFVLDLSAGRERADILHLGSQHA